MVVRSTQQVVETLSSGDGVVRATQQVVEVISGSQGDVRVTRQVVEVLSVVPADDLTQNVVQETLSLMQAVGLGLASSKAATSTLAMTQSADVEIVHPFTASNTLALTQSVRVSPISLTAVTPDEFTDPDEFLGGGFTSTWTQGGRIPLVLDLDASSTISLTSTAPQPHGSLNFSGISTLNLVDFADTDVKTRAPSSLIEITDEATFDKILTTKSILTLTHEAVQGLLFLDASSEITLTQNANSGPVTRSLESTIELTQSARSSLRNLNASNEIELTQDVVVIRPWYLNPSNVISGITDDIFIPPAGPLIPGIEFGLSQEATVSIVPSRSISQIIQLRQSASATHIKVGAIAKAATSTLSLTDIANLSLTGEATSLLSLTDAAVVNLNTTDVGSTLDSLLSVAFVGVVRATLPVLDTIGLKQSVGYSLIRDNTICEYSPFVGGSDAGTVPPPTALPAVTTPLAADVRFRLVYPPFGVTAVDTLDLRAPTFGNRERLEATRIQRETPGGTLIVYADPIWPKVHTLTMQFAALKETQARGLLDFLERWVGQEIGIYDYEGRYWKGIVLNPTDGVTQDGREKFSASLEIEAERVLV